MSEAKGNLYLRMEKEDFNVTTKLTFTGTSYTSVIEIIQTMSQVGINSADVKRHTVTALFSVSGIQDAGCQTVKVRRSSSCCGMFCP